MDCTSSQVESTSYIDNSYFNLRSKDSQMRNYLMSAQHNRKSSRNQNDSDWSDGNVELIQLQSTKNKQQDPKQRVTVTTTLKSRMYELQLPDNYKQSKNRKILSYSCDSKQQMRAVTTPTKSPNQREVFEKIKHDKIAQNKSYFDNLNKQFFNLTNRFQKQRERGHILQKQLQQQQLQQQQQQQQQQFNINDPSRYDPVLQLLQKWDPNNHKKPLNVEQIFKQLHSTPLKRIRTKQKVFQNHRDIILYPNSVVLPVQIQNLINMTNQRRRLQSQEANNFKFFI